MLTVPHGAVPLQTWVVWKVLQVKLYRHIVSLLCFHTDGAIHILQQLQMDGRREEEDERLLSVT